MGRLTKKLTSQYGPYDVSTKIVGQQYTYRNNAGMGVYNIFCSIISSHFIFSNRETLGSFNILSHYCLHHRNILHSTVTFIHFPATSLKNLHGDGHKFHLFLSTFTCIGIYNRERRHTVRSFVACVARGERGWDHYYYTYHLAPYKHYQ